MHYLRRGNLLPAALIIVMGVFTMRGPMPGLSTVRRQPFHSHSPIRRMLPVLGQNDQADENEVSTDQVEKYVSVYKAMQRNRSLTVDQAAAAQGLTLQQFRQLENRVQRDDAALQQARDELQSAAQQDTPNLGKNPPPLRP